MAFYSKDHLQQAWLPSKKEGLGNPRGHGEKLNMSWAYPCRFYYHIMKGSEDSFLCFFCLGKMFAKCLWLPSFQGCSPPPPAFKCSFTPRSWRPGRFHELGKLCCVGNILPAQFRRSPTMSWQHKSVHVLALFERAHDAEKIQTLMHLGAVLGEVL